MPATITHAYFGEDIYNRLPSDIKLKIKDYKTSLMMFSQSMDSLMFYNILSPLKGKNIRDLASVFHNNKVNIFFNNLIEYIKKKKLYNDPQTLAFLYGLIAHHSLDSTIHPFVFFKTGDFNKNDPNTYKYNGLHTYMETYIDNYMLEKRNTNVNNFKIQEFCFDIKPFSKELIDAIDYSFENTYSINNMSKKYYKSLKQMKTFLVLFRFDNHGIKKLGYKTIDFFTPKKLFRFNSLSYKLDNFDNYNFLNNKHKVWTYPIDSNLKSTKCFDQLYNDALNNSLNIIKELNLYFFKNKHIDINNLFKNKSYITGIDCNSKKRQLFFEF